MYQISLKLVHKNIISYVRLYVRCKEEEKYEENLPSFRDLYLRGTVGATPFKFSIQGAVCVDNKICRIGAIVFQL